MHVSISPATQQNLTHANQLLFYTETFNHDCAFGDMPREPRFTHPTDFGAHYAASRPFKYANSRDFAIDIEEFHDLRNRSVRELSLQRYWSTFHVVSLDCALLFNAEDLEDENTRVRVEIQVARLADEYASGRATAVEAKADQCARQVEECQRKVAELTTRKHTFTHGFCQ